MPYDLKRVPRSETQSAEAQRVGDELRVARTAMGVTLDEVSEQLRINRRYLEALEEGHWKDLPGVAYGAGFIRSYALAMGLDAADMVRRYRDAAGPQGRGKDLVFPEPVPDRGVPAGAIILVGALVAIGGYAAWYRWSGSAERSVDSVASLPPQLEEAARDAGQPPLPPAPRPAPSLVPPPGGIVPSAPLPGVTPVTPQGVAPASPPAATTPAPRPPDTTLTAPPPPAGGGGGAPAAPPPPSLPAQAEPATPPRQGIVLRANQECWVQIRDPRGGRVILSRLLRAGESYDVPQPSGLLLTAGRIEALTIEVDGVQSRAFTDQQGVRRDILLDAERLRSAEAGQIPVR